MVLITSDTVAFNPLKSFCSITVFEINCDPIPTQVTPASNQDFKFSFDVFTPPVGIILVHGCGPLMALTNSGP